MTITDIPSNEPAADDPPSSAADSQGPDSSGPDTSWSISLRSMPRWCT